MNQSKLIHTAAFLAIGLIVVATSNVMSSPLNSQVKATTASPMALYAHDVAKAIRRAETGALSIEDR
ncbi:MAG TPA: hypothetical protein VMQ11_13445 [Alphaproteobacteria bacterium]|nr:hypothetical protein [Alphaproteobacteria bacterium]